MNSFLVIPIAIVMILATACAQSQESGDIGPKAAKKLIETEEIVIMDVRTDEEWESGHIEGALHNDVYSDKFKKRLSKMDKSAKTLVYCASGGRSNSARQMMEEIGFTNVINMTGGIGGWRALEYPLVK